MDKKTFYVTTPIYYVNARPHMGTLYSTVLADVAARWNKLLGKQTFFLTGLDEHGQKIAQVAVAAGVTPKAFVDSMVPYFKDMWQRYELEFNRFIRTTDADHEQAVVAFLRRLQDKGDIYKSSYTGFYCTPCETFVADSSIVKDNPVCPSCNRPVHELSEESYFFRLSAYQDQLLAFYEQNPDFIVPKERLNEVIAFVKSGLRDLSFSRKTVGWGIPFPGDPEHTVYVWGDALVNYISAIGFGKTDPASISEFAAWWPADLHIMGKDIVRFHAVYWPAMLLAAGLPLPRRLLVHGYLLMGGEKMSKSKGNVLDPADLANKYGVEPVRYYLMRHTTISQDSSITIQEIENAIAADLANGLGNLLSRTLTLALRNNLGTVSPITTLEASSALLKEQCGEAFRGYWDGMNHYQYHLALASVLKFVNQTNAYVSTLQPWVLAKTNKPLFDEVISSVCHSLYATAIMLWPIMPHKMEQLLKTLGESVIPGANYAEILRKNEWNKTFKLANLEEPLFPRPESNDAVGG